MLMLLHHDHEIEVNMFRVPSKISSQQARALTTMCDVMQVMPRGKSNV